MGLHVIILAAGQGSRMKSKLPKVLHPLAGKPLMGHVIDAAKSLQAEGIHVVIGHGSDQVKAYYADEALHWYLQKQQLGTAHAVAQTLPGIPDHGTVLVLYGDVPLITGETISRLCDVVKPHEMALLTVKLDDPTGYGRIIRTSTNQVAAIVEHKDADSEQLLVNEVNSGILAIDASDLKELTRKIDNQNAQSEYYLTDLIELMASEGRQVHAHSVSDPFEVQGVNNRMQLEELERHYQKAKARTLQSEGVTLADASRIDVRGELQTGTDVFIDINCVFEGKVILADDVYIGPNCIIRDSRLDKGVRIEANTIVDNSVVGQNAVIGPFARLRPGSELADSTKVGNFVELKKASLGHGAKVNHLSYIGDAEIGDHVNVGAGTITCNYDGVNKHKTRVGAGTFVGSNTSLVAPLEIGDNATIGAGSTVTSDVSDNQLAVARARQRNINNWKKPTKQ